ncbi:MAG: glycosyltransferase family 4 protein [Prochlorotrichaceae cyanobacterium]
MNLLFLSTSIGYLGSGLGGGVELTLANVAQALTLRGHSVTIVAPQGSTNPHCAVIEVEGMAQVSAQRQERSDPILIPAQSVLARMWERAREIQGDYDLLVNFAYDWLPFYLTPFFQRPIAHLVSMGSLSEVMDEAIGAVAQQFPGTIAVHSKAQAQTFAFAQACRCVGNGLDLSLYRFHPQPAPYLGWIGRIAPEKGLEDAIAAIVQSQQTLKIWGKVEDEAYWQWIQAQFPPEAYRYEGFLSTTELQAALGHCRGLLMTPHWVEAFGNVAIEALACGVPVIAYDRGGPSEIVRSGETGWIVEPDSISGLVAAIGSLDQIDRAACRQQAEAEYSLAALGDRFEAWFQDCLAGRGVDEAFG